MAQQPMYPGMIGSPTTTLTAAISGSTTSFSVANGNALPEAPNLATLGSGQNAEIVLYSTKSGNTLSGVTRGFQGSAQPHAGGTLVSRRLTAYDLDALRQNHEALVAQKGAANGVATLDATGRVQQNPRVHNLVDTVNHPVTGLTAGDVLRASGASEYTFTQLSHEDLGSVSANQHHNQNHALIDTAGHTVSGLTTGHFLRATGDTTYAFQAHGLVRGDVGLENVDNVQQIPTAQKGAANGVATLDATGRVPPAQVPATTHTRSFMMMGG